MSGLYIHEEGDEAIKAKLVKTAPEAEPSRLRQSPFPHGKTIISLPDDAALIVLARNAAANWLKVVYTNPDHQAVVGWLPLNTVENVTFREMPVDIADLPVTEHLHERSDEIAARIAELQSKTWRSLLPYSWLWLGAAIVIGIATYLLILNDASSDYTPGAIVQGIAFGLTGGVFTYIIAQAIADRHLRREITELQESLDPRRSRLIVNDVNTASGAAVVYWRERQQQRQRQPTTR